MNVYITIKQRLIWSILGIMIRFYHCSWCCNKLARAWFICGNLFVAHYGGQTVRNNIVSVLGWNLGVSLACQADSTDMSAACLVSLSCLHFQLTQLSRHLQLRVPHHVRRCSYYHHVLHCTPLCTSFHLHDSYHQHFLNESFHFPPTASLFTTTSDFMLLLFTAPLLNATINCHLHICISVVLLVHLLFFSHHTACSS